MSVKYFKTKQNLDSIEVLCDRLKNQYGDKYKIELERAAKGAMKFFSEQQSDMISIKKNAYHGIYLSPSGNIEGADYQTISIAEYTPNSIVDHFIGRTGILDILIAKLIWGKGDDFYAEIDNFIKTEYAADQVDNSFLNNAKQLLKGKSVFDE